MSSYRLSNLFIPSFSKRLMITNHDNSKPILVNMKNNDDQDIKEYAIPSGISDAAWLNINYKELMNEPSVSEVSNQETQEKILHVWKNDDKLDSNYAKLKFLDYNKSASYKEKKLIETEWWKRNYLSNSFNTTISIQLIKNKFIMSNMASFTLLV